MRNLIENLVKEEADLEKKVKDELERRFEEIDLNYILSNPKGELTLFAVKIMEEVFMKYANSFVLAGVKFADAVNKAKKPLEVVNNG